MEYTKPFLTLVGTAKGVVLGGFEGAVDSFDNPQDDIPGAPETNPGEGEF